MAQILIAGCGYVGNQLSDMLVTGHHQVWGLRRSASSAPAGQHPFSADLTKPETLTDLPKNLDYIFYTASASSIMMRHTRSPTLMDCTTLLKHSSNRDRSPTVSFSHRVPVFMGNAMAPGLTKPVQHCQLRSPVSAC